MKKLLAAALAAMMMFAVVGCGAKDEAPAEDANNDATVEENAEAPAEDAEAPAEDAEAPAEDAEAPAEDAEAPAEDADAPAEEAPTEEKAEYEW